MKYSFNQSRFAQIMTERGLNKTIATRMLGRKNSSTIQNWMDGEKIESTHLVQICNTFDVNPAEFFLLNKKPIVTPKGNKMSSGVDETGTPAAPIDLVQQQLKFVDERAELEKNHLQQVADIEKNHAREVSELEKAHLRELMQKDIDLAKKEASIREEIRREMRDEYESQITTLRNQLLDLTAQYRELELTSRSYSNITAVADNKGSNYVAKK